MSTEKMREEFEAWVKTFNRMPAALFQDSKGCYINDFIECRWLGWEASRQHILIDLPTEYDCCGGTTSYEIRDMAIEAVKDKGLGVANE